MILCVMNCTHIYLFYSITAEIVNQFKNQNIQLQWQELQNQILTQNYNRTAKDELHKIQINQELDKWKKGNEIVQKKLDEKVDELRAKFADLEFALNHDVGNLEKKFDQVPKVCLLYSVVVNICNWKPRQYDSFIQICPTRVLFLNLMLLLCAALCSQFGGNDSCLDVRKDLVSCFKSKKDGRECDAFVELLENCTKQTVMSA